MGDEIILQIEESSEITRKKNNFEKSYSGFIIKTNKQIINIGIGNEQSCCEEWGYISTNDDINEFIGAILNNIKLTDAELKTHEVLEDLYEGCFMFINLETNKGTLQFVLYNAHNGYYSHHAFIESAQLNYDEYL